MSKAFWTSKDTISVNCEVEPWENLKLYNLGRFREKKTLSNLVWSILLLFLIYRDVASQLTSSISFWLSSKLSLSSFFPSEAVNEESLVDFLLYREDWEKELISGLFSPDATSESLSSSSSTFWKVCSRETVEGNEKLTAKLFWSSHQIKRYVKFCMCVYVTCMVTRVWYTPSFSINSLWVPTSAISPLWKPAMTSAFLMVERRWATIMVVRPSRTYRQK